MNLIWVTSVWNITAVYWGVTTCILMNVIHHMSREEKPTRCHWMVYYAYNMLSMFRALLCPSSGARDCMCVIIVCGVQCMQEDFLGVKAAGAYGWQPYHLPVPLSWNLGTLTSWNWYGIISYLKTRNYISSANSSTNPCSVILRLSN